MSNKARKNSRDILRAAKPRTGTQDFVLHAEARNELIRARTALKRAETALEAAEAAAEAALEADRDTAAVVDELSVVTARTRAADAKAALEEAEADAAPHTVTFEFRALSRRALAAIRAEHPPTDADRAEWDRRAAAAGIPKSQRTGPEVCFETFAPAMAEATIIDPAFGPGEFAELVWDSDAWTDTDLGALIQSCDDINGDTAALPLFKQ